MSNNPIQMHKLRQIIRLYCQGTGLKTIQQLVGTSRNTIRKYIRTLDSLGLSYDEFSSKSDGELSQLFATLPTSVPENSRKAILDELLTGYIKRLSKKGVTREMLHKEYLELHPGGYARSRFNNMINIHGHLCRPVMHLDHKAGDKMYVDFTGSKLQLTDEYGKAIDVEVFVAILGCSQLTYVEAVASQKKEDFIKACENSLHYFGGVPQAIVPDNLKSAVTKGSKYEAILNEEFASFAEHYSITAIPARVYKPKDKSLVEGAVKLIYRSIYTRLEGRTFSDLQSLNSAIMSALEIHNNKPFSGRTYSRRDQFEDIEREALGPLNQLRYQISTSPCRGVISFAEYVTRCRRSDRLGEDIHYYSVPYTYIGKKVKILYTGTQVDVFYRYTMIASHARVMAKYHYTTNSDHLASQHRFITDWTPEKFIDKALDIHADVAHYIGKVLEHKPYPEQAYKSCSGILSFAHRVGEQRLTQACRWADSLGQYNYLVIEEILRKKLDHLEHENEFTQIPSHDNIRGKEYYQ